MIVKAIIRIYERTDDIEGVECVTGETVTETDLSIAVTECIGPTATCGCVELELDLALESCALCKIVKERLEVIATEALLCIVNGRTVNDGDVLGCIVAVLVCVCSQLSDSSIELLFCKIGGEGDDRG